ATVATLDRLGDTLLPGARDRGFTHFIDSQAGGPAADFLGLLRYMDWPPPYAAFYVDGAAALEALSQDRHAAPFHALDDGDATALVASISAAQPANWSGPPAPLFYFVTRSDAVDVCYGTMDGFAALNVPYVAHIPPPERW
ncbi:MAG: gluconate 2-dehydrogenase subunit 3 family protein, partial [Gammaproteobacteria bacterium]|nr:gluconate 2-dehydrogenase subunit 3 family protein [Gammaproteobacteria bacterium]